MVLLGARGSSIPYLSLNIYIDIYIYISICMHLLYMYNMDGMLVVLGARGFCIPNMYVSMYVLYMYNIEGIVVVLKARGSCIPNICV